MRHKVIAGNWKMNNDINQTTALINGIAALLKQPNAEVIVCPPYTSLQTAHHALANTGVKLGAQDVSLYDSGAYTGEVSAAMLKSVGCSYIIVGHSERRQYHRETNEVINQKAKKVLSAGLIPIICVGETLEEREKNITHQVLSTQINGVLSGIAASDVEKSIIAYEPVWAIGTGKTATKEQAQEAHQYIRSLIATLYSKSSADKVVIQYGGSVKPENAKELLTQPDIDGALVGGACLKAESFAAIIQSV